MFSFIPFFKTFCFLKILYNVLLEKNHVLLNCFTDTKTRVKVLISHDRQRHRSWRVLFMILGFSLLPVFLARMEQGNLFFFGSFLPKTK